MVIDPANRRMSHATLLVLPSCCPPSAQPTSPQRTAAHGSPSATQSSASILCRSTQPTEATHTQHLAFFRRVVRPRHSPRHLTELPPSGPHLPTDATHTPHFSFFPRRCAKGGRHEGRRGCVACELRWLAESNDEEN